jgi:hypothetical protein
VKICVNDQELFVTKILGSLKLASVAITSKAVAPVQIGLYNISAVGLVIS